MPHPIVIGDFVAPDTDVAKAAASLVEQVHTRTFMNHVHRTWWFAEFIGRKRNFKHDRELLYTASLLHDLGLTEKYAADKRFEVDGANAAASFMRHQGYPETKVNILWNAIALHSIPDVAESREPEVALVHFGAHVDVMGLRIDEIPALLVEDTLTLFPRLGFKKAFTEALAEVARKKPYTAVGTGLADIGRRLVDGLTIPNVCELIYSAPFES